MHSLQDPRQRHSDAGRSSRSSSGRYDEVETSRGRHSLGAEVPKGHGAEKSSALPRTPVPPGIGKRENSASTTLAEPKNEFGPVTKREVEIAMDQILQKMEKKSREDEKSDAKEPRLEGVNPSMDEVPNILLDYRKAANEPFVGARFIFEIGIKLEVKPTTIATAASLFHRFWTKTTSNVYDICTIGGTSMFIAVKIENEKVKPRDIINVIHHSINRESELLDMDEKYFTYKNGLVQCELFMMRVLKFQVTYDHPHKYLVHYLRSIQFWKGFRKLFDLTPGFMKAAWSFLQDFYHDPDCIVYEPQELAIAAIDIATEMFGFSLDTPVKKSNINWKNVFFTDFNEQTHMTIKGKMLDVYEKEKEFVKKYRYEDNKNVPVIVLEEVKSTPSSVPPPAPGPIRPPPPPKIGSRFH